MCLINMDTIILNNIKQLKFTSIQKDNSARTIRNYLGIIRHVQYSKIDQWDTSHFSTKENRCTWKHLTYATYKAFDSIVYMFMMFWKQLFSKYKRNNLFWKWGSIDNLYLLPYLSAKPVYKKKVINWTLLKLKTSAQRNLLRKWKEKLQNRRKYFKTYTQ